MVFARNENTKDTLIRGVGMRFSIANWLMAGELCFQAHPGDPED